MGKMLQDVDQQVRSLIGDYQKTTFTPADVCEAINWASNLVITVKGFKTGSRLYALGVYPTGSLPTDMLLVKYVQLVTQASPVFGADSSDATDVVLRVLTESTVELENAFNEQWRIQRVSFPPKRWVYESNQQFTAVPPSLPSDASIPSGYIRLKYIKMCTPVVYTVPTGLIDTSIPDYYQEAIRYAAVAYLMEKDTDLKSMQLKDSMLASFNAHMAGGIHKLASPEVDT